MPEYTEICSSAEIGNGQMKAFSVRGQEILIAKVDNEIYATNNKCPHMKARLSIGTLEGTIITCPKHASQFDLKDGRVIRWTNLSGTTLVISKVFRSPRPLEVFPVKVEGDKVFVKI